MQLLINNFINGYISCMKWSTPGETPDGEELIDLTGFTVSEEALQTITEDCEKFVNSYKDLLSQVYTNPTEYQNAGHDFWLTRNGHGAGFWDRGFGVLGDALTARAQGFKELTPYIGDDEKIYFLE